MRKSIKPSRAFLFIGTLFLALYVLPLSMGTQIKSSTYSVLEAPFAAAKWIASGLNDFIFFYRNAEENRALKRRIAQLRLQKFQWEEATRENARLVKLLNVKSSILNGRITFARVLVYSPSSWSKIILVDKGLNDGLRAQKLVLSEMSLVGKVIETGPTISKVRLLTDPNSRIGALIQRSRAQGIVFGTSQGACRMKYIGVDSDAQVGDVVETAGVGGYLPKGLPIGTVKRVWKEPGQVYQVVEIQPFADLGKLEEVSVLD